MSLREEKQRRQRDLIIENAIALFRELGFEAVRVRDIAAASVVSDATFFNYFGSKEAVLREWAERAFEPPAPPRAATGGPAPLRRAVRAWAAHLAERVEADPEMMRLAWGRVRTADFAQPRPPVRGREPRPATLAILIEEAQAQGEVRADLDAGTLSLLLQGGLATCLVAWLAAPEERTGEPLRKRLSRAADLILDGFRKRNERVSGPARTSPAPR